MECQAESRTVKSLSLNGAFTSIHMVQILDFWWFFRETQYATFSISATFPERWKTYGTKLIFMERDKAESFYYIIEGKVAMI